MQAQQFHGDGEKRHSAWRWVRPRLVPSHRRLWVLASRSSSPTDRSNGTRPRRPRRRPALSSSCPQHLRRISTLGRIGRENLTLARSAVRRSFGVGSGLGACLEDLESVVESG